MDNFVNMELAKKIQKEDLNRLKNNSTTAFKAFDIEMEEFNMIDDHFNDHSSPKSML